MNKSGSHSKSRSLVVIVLVTALGVAPAQAAAQDSMAQDNVAQDLTGLSEDAVTVAVYGGRIIDLANNWEGARACLVWSDAIDTPECFDTEEEMDRRIVELEKMTGDVAAVEVFGGGVAASGTSCSGYLRLYDGSFYTGAVLYIRGRFQWFDLASFNFNQRTSSFKIGPCSAYFADFAGGGGAWYPISQTEAYDVALVSLT